MFLGLFIFVEFKMCSSLAHTGAENSDFASVASSPHFVDKTLLIKEFFKYKTNNRMLVTAPRRFGKSLNMNMIKTFSEALLDEKGNWTIREETENYKTFADNNLTIFQDSVFFDKHFGKYPVIFLNFSQLNYSGFDVFISGFKAMISAEFESRRYLLKSSILTKRDSGKREGYYNKTVITDLHERDLRKSMLFLSKLLFVHFNYTKCIILIDDYDTPVRNAIVESSSDLESILEFMRNFNAEVLKSNPNVDRALINSCLAIGDVITAKDTNIKYIPFLEDARFLDFYGFMKDEVKVLLKKVRKLHMLEVIQKWYGGYSVQMGNIRVFNPFSILNFLKYKKIERFWAKSVNIDDLEEVFLYPEVKKKIEKIMDTTVEIKATHKIKIKHISRLKEIVNITQTDISEKDADLFIKYLTDLGYFNVVYNGEKVTILDIPNLELNYEIDNIISYTSYFINKTNI
ncbi:uncharacterized protein LOC128984792 [Macrosteles quadrilineatus]|uniref:uncharacterized protein LOC128984792 n=1 Tax=Macrosteles quadrilineatus TaxID=74068 RepID=UPI0023E1F6E6|nr:uncharacterized protein LOC128984792 [Macrosteles quadrilineatus]